MDDRHTMTALSVLLGFGLSVSTAATVEAQPIVGCKADEKDRHRLLVIKDPKSLKSNVLRTFSGKIVDSSPSTSGRYIGALVAKSLDREKGLWSFALHVVNEQGKTVTEVDNAQDFKFSPDDRYVAVTIGTPYEGASGFRPQATRVVDLQTMKSWDIPELKDATEIDWTTLPDDGLSLIAKKPTGRSKVWKYRMKNRRALATKWKSIHFSPDGKYYYMTPREAIDAGLCKAKDKNDSCVRAFSWKNKEVKLRIRKRIRRLLGWTGRTGHELAAEEGYGADEHGMEIDLETGRMAILKEKINRKWKTRRGVRILEEKRGRLKARTNKLFDELDRLKQRRQERRERRRRRRQNDY